MDILLASSGERSYQTEAEWKAYEEGFLDAGDSGERMEEIIATRARELFLEEMKLRYPKYGKQWLECTMPDCTKLQKAKGYCAMHYARLSKWGDPTIVRKAYDIAPRSNRIAPLRCSISWCHRLEKKGGMCHTHYHNWLKRKNVGRGDEYLKFLEEAGPPETRTGRYRGGIQVPGVWNVPVQREGNVDEAVL